MTKASKRKTQAPETEEPKPQYPTPIAAKMTGRPSVYKEDYHPDEYFRLAAMGRTRAQICFEWGIHRDTLHDWSRDKKKPLFSDAVKKGDEARTSWWTNLGLLHATGQIKGNIAAWIFLAKNVCPNDFRNKDRDPEVEVEAMDFGEGEI